MAYNISQWISAGVDRGQWAYRDSTGYMVGTASTLANGSDSGMGFLYVASAEYSVPEAEQVNINANDTRLGSFLFASSDASSFTLELGANDMAFIAAAQGTPIVTVGDWDMMQIRPGTLTFNNLILLLTSQAQSYESATVGAAGYRNLLLPNVRLTYLGATGMTVRGEQTYRFTAVVNAVSVLPWGTAFATVTDGSTTADGREFISQNRVSMHTHRGNASDTTLTLNYTPAANDGAKVYLWQDGVAKTYTTDYTVSGTTFTFASAPGAGVKSTILYEHI